MLTTVDLSGGLKARNSLLTTEISDGWKMGEGGQIVD